MLVRAGLSGLALFASKLIVRNWQMHSAPIW